VEADNGAKGKHMSEARRYRKKPVVIEAIQLRWDTWSEMCNFVTVDGFHGVEDDYPKIMAVIPTLEGDMIANEGDFIIRGVQGEFYPCKPDIFAATYEQVDMRLRAWHG
jgi:hypothetical protein